jgi:DNA-binding NarL/FixJ family response regulator
VLLVDDHEGFLASARALLVHEGFDVVGESRTGEDALDMVARISPDLVLLDLRLPGMSGVDVAHAVSSHDDAPEVILISSDADAGDEPDVKGAPVRGFLPKRDLTCAAIEALLA